MKKLVLLIFLTFFLVACDLTADSGLDYSDFLAITLTDTDDQLTQEEDLYYLYFFSPYCSACDSIKNEVLYKITLLRIDRIYLVETLSGDAVATDISVTNIPTLVKVVDHQVEAYFVGTTQVKEELKTLS